MNERIRQLAEQAGIVFWEMSGDVDWRQANTETLEKFAELIVRECSAVIQKEVSLYYKDGGPPIEDIPSEAFMAGHCAGSTWARVMIKQHFGVEE